MARWDPDKCWLGTVEIVAAMERARWRPLLIARGGSEPHGAEVLAAMEALGLHRIDRECREPGVCGLLEALSARISATHFGLVASCVHEPPRVGKPT